MVRSRASPNAFGAQKATLRPGDVVVASARSGGASSSASTRRARRSTPRRRRAPGELVGLGGEPVRRRLPRRRRERGGGARDRGGAPAASSASAARRRSSSRARRRPRVVPRRGGGRRAAAPRARLRGEVRRAGVGGGAGVGGRGAEAADDSVQGEEARAALGGGRGDVGARDVMLASVSNAIVIGFNSRRRGGRDEAAKANIEPQAVLGGVRRARRDQGDAGQADPSPPSKRSARSSRAADVLRVQDRRRRQGGGLPPPRRLHPRRRNIRILRGNLIVYEGIALAPLGQVGRRAGRRAQRVRRLVRRLPGHGGRRPRRRHAPRRARHHFERRGLMPPGEKRRGPRVRLGSRRHGCGCWDDDFVKTSRTAGGARAQHARSAFARSPIPREARRSTATAWNLSITPMLLVALTRGLLSGCTCRRRRCARAHTAARRRRAPRAQARGRPARGRRCSRSIAERRGGRARKGGALEWVADGLDALAEVVSPLHRFDDEAVQDSSKNLQVLWSRAVLAKNGELADDIARSCCRSRRAAW